MIENSAHFEGEFTQICTVCTPLYNLCTDHALQAGVVGTIWTAISATPITASVRNGDAETPFECDRAGDQEPSGPRRNSQGEPEANYPRLANVASPV